MVSRSVVAAVLLSALLLSAVPGYAAAASSHGRLLKQVASKTGPTVNASGGSKTASTGGANGKSLTTTGPTANINGGGFYSDGPLNNRVVFPSATFRGPRANLNLSGGRKL